MAYDTTFGGNKHLTCVWMDDNYNWNNPTFADRCGQSLNLAVNAVADVLHTLYQQTEPSSIPTPTSTQSPTPSPSPMPVLEFPTMQILTVAMLTVMAMTMVYKKSTLKEAKHC
jgi:hypothetical protein